VRLSIWAGAIICTFAVIRVATGIGYRPEQFQVQFRAISYIDSTILFLPLCFLVGRMLIDPSNRLREVAAIILLVGVQIVSGYRLAWALTLTLPTVIAVFAARRAGRTRAALISLPAVVAVGVGLSVLLSVNRGLFTVWESRAMELVRGSGAIQLGWRFLSWSTALRKFAQHPFIGVGIGDAPSFWAVNGAGNPVLVEHTTHNVFVDTLYQTGILGFVFFLLVHGSYAWLLLRAFARAPISELPYACALVGFYAAAVAVSALQPFMSTPAGATLVYAVMGLSVLDLVRWQLTPGRGHIRETCPKKGRTIET
jgi:O-antigen ligase